MKKIKVLIVITKTNWGGAQRYVYDITTSLSRDIFDISVAGGGTGEKNTGTGTLVKKLEDKNIPFIFLPHLIRNVSVFREFSAFFDLIRLFKKEEPDVVHLNSSKIGALGSLAARLCGIKKIIFTAHGFAIDENRPWYQKSLIAVISWLTVLFSTETIVILKKDVERIRHWPFISNKKIHLVYNGIGPIDFISKDAARKEILNLEIIKNINLETKWIGTIAELHKNKGLEYAIEGFARLNSQDAIFVIIGSGEEHENLEKVIEKLNVKQKIFFAGYKENASRLLKGFDIFIMASIKEGFPYALLEAGAASLPVLSTDIGGIPEIIENNKSGILIQPKNIEEISKGLNCLLTDTAERENFGAALHQKVTSSFSIKDEIEKLEELYRD